MKDHSFASCATQEQWILGIPAVYYVVIMTVVHIQRFLYVLTGRGNAKVNVLVVTLPWKNDARMGRLNNHHVILIPA